MSSLITFSFYVSKDYGKREFTITPSVKICTGMSVVDVYGDVENDTWQLY